MVVFTKNYKGKTLKIVNRDDGIEIYIGEELVVMLDTSYSHARVHIYDEEQDNPVQTETLFV